MIKNKDSTDHGNFSLNKTEEALFERVKIALNEHEVVQLETELKKSLRKGRRQTSMPIRIAASLVILFALTSLVWHLSVPKNKRIFNTFYSPYNSENIAGIYRDTDTGKNSAIHFYSLRKYREAKPLFEDYLTQKPGDQQVILLLSISLIELKQYHEAEYHLKEIIKNGNNLFDEDAMWYLSLLHIRKGETGLALNYLRYLEKSKSYESRVQALNSKITK